MVTLLPSPTVSAAPSGANETSARASGESAMHAITNVPMPTQRVMNGACAARWLRILMVGNARILCNSRHVRKSLPRGPWSELVTMSASLRLEGRFGSHLGIDGDFLPRAGRRLDLQRDRHALARLQCMREPGQDDAVRSGSRLCQNARVAEAERLPRLKHRVSSGRQHEAIR